MDNHFTIMMLGYNSAPWIRRCVESALQQDYDNFDVIAVDAETNDGTYYILKEYESNPRLTLIRNEKRKYVSENICVAMDAVTNDDTIVCCLDFDDQLMRGDVLQVLNREYDENTWLTYGSYADCYVNDDGSCSIYPNDKLERYSDFAIETNNFRHENWQATHLRTFRKKLFDKVDRESFIDPDTGTWYEMAGDMGLMFPLLELAGNRFKCIKDQLYLYNKQNPMSDDRVSLERQVSCENKIRNAKKYQPLEKL